MRYRSRIVTVALALSVSATLAGAAYGAPPYSQPQPIYSTGFEPGQPSAEVAPIVILGDSVSAFWGGSGTVFRSGAKGLWCAGTDASTGGPGAFVSTYPAFTRGFADLRIPALADYFESSLSFWYLMPSLGRDDHFTVSVGRLGESGVTTAQPTYVSGDEVAVSSAWKERRYRLGSGTLSSASRQPLVVRFVFIDNVESAPFGLLGRGPTIDDVAVTGYKYGPVRNPTATWSDGVGMELTWRTPAASAYSTADDPRPIRYRIWRSPRNADKWTALASVAPMSATGFVDGTAGRAHAYDYAVQAWDGDGASRYGVQSPTLRVPAPPPIVTSASKTLTRYGSSYVLTGRVEADGRPISGEKVVLETARSAAGPFAATGIVAVTASNGSFSLSHTPRSKTYYRARIVGQSGPAASSAVRSATPKAYVRTPIAPRTMRAGRASTVYGYLKPRHTAGTYPVRIYRYRYVGGKWKRYGYVKAKAISYSSYTTKYTAKVKLPYRGRWRLRAYHPADSSHAASWSGGFDYVTVR